MSAACPLFGFDVLFVPVAGVDESALDALRADFLAVAIDRQGLVAQSDAAVRWSHTVTRDGGQATDADREAIADWASAHAMIVTCQVGPLVDLSPSA